jgi:hypothetical protein
MERNRNWQGWVAIALAGLALIVALGGHMPWGGRQRNMMMGAAGQPGAWQAPQGPQAPQAPQGPQAPAGPRFGRGQGQGQGKGWGMMGQGRGQGMMGQNQFRAGPMGRHGGPGIFGIFGMLFGLAKLVAFGLLAWLLLRTFMQRRSAPTAPVPTTPAGHDPTIE